MKKSLIALSILPLLAACDVQDAQVANQNMQKAADNFEIVRRIVFYNAIRDSFMLEIIGKCAVHPNNLRLSVTCKVGPGQFKRHFLGVSDNAPYFVEQLEPVPVNVYHYRVTFKPQTILPNIDFRGDVKSAVDALTPDNRD